MMILHPDEKHDGEPGTDEGFRYRIFYIDPALVGRATGYGTLPFVPGAVLDDQRAVSALWPLFNDFEEPLDALAAADIVASAARALSVAARADDRRCRATVDSVAVYRARTLLLDTGPGNPVGLDLLERETDLDRWRLTRQFRAAFGTSPYRFFLLRRLDAARTLLARGTAIADAAAATGFADQAHLTRQFKRGYGLTPKRWLTMTARGSAV